MQGRHTCTCPNAVYGTRRMAVGRNAFPCMAVGRLRLRRLCCPCHPMVTAAQRQELHSLSEQCRPRSPQIQVRRRGMRRLSRLSSEPSIENSRTLHPMLCHCLCNGTSCLATPPQRHVLRAELAPDVRGIHYSHTQWTARHDYHDQACGAIRCLEHDGMHLGRNS